MDTQDIIKFIKNQDRLKGIKAVCKGDFSKLNMIDDVVFNRTKDNLILIGPYNKVMNWINSNEQSINFYHVEFNDNFSRVAINNIFNINALVEPGAIIRDKVHLDKSVIVMMGAYINHGVVIGENTTIDSNSFIGMRAVIGKNCHIGSNAIIMGTKDLIDDHNVVIEDNVRVGDNSVILSGITIKKGAIVTNGTVVTKDIEENMVVSGIPGKVFDHGDYKHKKK